MKRSIPTPLERKGFALIITISLLVLLALVAVGLLSLSTVTVRSAQLGAAQSEARANAKLALMLALGDLQKAMGPDARISARAETLAQDPRLGATVRPNTGKAWWVGVSNSDPERGLSDQGTEDDEPDPIGPDNPEVLWLVSGLDLNATPSAQIAGAVPFENPVTMYGDKTIDTDALTGGQPIEAGSVLIENQSGQSAGGFAYFIDDNGMKAQLAASNPEVRNDRKLPYGGGVLPGTYDLSILDGLASLAGTPMEDYNKMASVNDLPLMGESVPATIVREKRLGYTTRSHGVLSDVRKGGLKRDLTIAFEREKEVFKNVFPIGQKDRYVVMDREKFEGSRDLMDNGYIHWDIFFDYYNIKKYIKRKGGGDLLDTFLLDKNSLFSGYNTPFGLGKLGPHLIGKNSNTPGRHQELPYGDYRVVGDASSNTSQFKHNPVMPILSRMQQNAWVESIPASSRKGKPKIKTHVQLWASQYNPYNINLNVVGDAASFGPRLINYPQIYFTIPGLSWTNPSNGRVSPFSRMSGFAGKRQSSVPYEVILGPGRSHVCAFKDHGAKGWGDLDERLYSDAVKDLTLQSIYAEYELASSPGRSSTLEVDFVLERPSMIQGANSNAHSSSHEVAQVMWAPFAWDAINRNRPGKKIIQTVRGGALNENTMASLSFALRTTREGSGAIRPLIDANIRSIMCNTKWDSPLGVDLLAGYSAENEGETDEQIFQMDLSDPPRGHTYWGGGNDPGDGHDRVILFDIPRQDLVSLGQLQHASAGRFSYEPTYIVGNSYANLRIPLDEWRAKVKDTFSTADRGLTEWAIPGEFNLYDASYLVNEELWDSYIFTTIPQAADNYGRTSPDPVPTNAHYAALLSGDATLPNPRFLPYEPKGSQFTRDILQKASSSRGRTGGFYHNAGHLLVDGSFNVNSTSVDAWEAFLSGTHQLPWQRLSTKGSIVGFAPAAGLQGVRFPRVKSVLGDPMMKDAPNLNYWTGFRDLDSYEIRELAEAIVEEIKERGPFLTLGEFVNRKLESGDHGERGALQAALDATVNKDLDPSFEDDASHPDVPEDSTQGAGFPGQLLQGDILQALSPYMTVRSDTFTIRAYGESRAAGSDDVQARAWCEATVQRFPDPVDDPDSTRTPLAELVKPSSKYGRTFRIVSFRWLSPNEI